MKFDLNDPSIILSHILFQDFRLAMAVAETPGWKEEQLVTPTILFNDVAVPAQVFEDALTALYKQIERRHAEKYADVEAEVQRRLEQRVQDEAVALLEKMQEISLVLSDAKDIIKPYWDQ